MLVSNVKGVEECDGYPLQLEIEEMRTEETEFNAAFVHRMLPKVRYDALRIAAAAAGCDLPEALDATDEDALRRVHTALCDVHVVKGALVCPKSGRRFPINNGIPNMLLHEDEV